MYSAKIGLTDHGIGLDLIRRSLGQHPALLQHGDAFDQLEEGVHVMVDHDHGTAPGDRLQPGSRFGSLADAREVIVDFLDAYAWEPETSEVYVLSIARGEWRLKSPRIIDAYLGYASDGPFAKGKAKLDSVFTFKDVPYQWLPLVKEKVIGR